MFDLIESELTRIRRLAEQAGDKLLVYFIDIAIIESNRRARSIKDELGDFGAEQRDEKYPGDCN
jgi:hypothetical protein